MNTEHVDVGPDYSDTQVAEIFLHHRVLIVPVVDDGRVDRRDHPQRLLPRRSPSASSNAEPPRARRWAAQGTSDPREVPMLAGALGRELGVEVLRTGLALGQLRIAAY